MTAQAKPHASMTIPVAGSGKRFGHIVLPWSRNESGWGSLRIPIAVVSGGKGPTVLLTGGNHGDEFEGPLALNDLVRTLDPATVQGTIIILPTLNYPALKAGTRLSPIDGGNMNRSFRGRRDGTITEQIAHFVEEELVARADAVLDMHAGGKTMLFHPLAVSHKLADEAQTTRAKDALLAFGAPVGLVIEELDNEGMLDTAVERRGKLFISTELGGGGSTDPRTMRLARQGLQNFLVHVGAIKGELIKPTERTRLMTNDADGYVACSHPGLIEFTCDLGSPVHRGECIARIYDYDHFDVAAKEIVAPVDGVLLGRLHGGLAQLGDFIALIAQDL